MSPLEDSAHWRTLAREVLAIADRVEDPENKLELVVIAEKYLGLADRAYAGAADLPPVSRCLDGRRLRPRV
jgi:hypothetical protein